MLLAAVDPLYQLARAWSLNRRVSPGRSSRRHGVGRAEYRLRAAADSGPGEARGWLMRIPTGRTAPCPGVKTRTVRESRRAGSPSCGWNYTYLATLGFDGLLFPAMPTAPCLLAQGSVVRGGPPLRLYTTRGIRCGHRTRGHVCCGRRPRGGHHANHRREGRGTAQ